MRIVFSTTYFIPYISGLSLYVERLAKGLVKRGHAITVLCMHHADGLAFAETIEGVSVRRAHTLIPLHKGFLSWEFVRLAWEQAKVNDVIVVHLPQVEGIWSAFFGKLFQKKVIAVYHSEVLLPDGFINSVVQSLLEIANMITMVFSETIVTYTEDFARHSKLLRFFVKKIRTTFPPIPVPKERSAYVRALKKKMGTADIVIGVAARLAAEKGLEYLFDAIPQLTEMYKGKKIKIVIAGSPNPVGEKVYRQKIQHIEQQYRDTLVFLGEISPSDMGSFYALLDVLVLPSVNNTETFGMVQVEAMMMGVPVVASDLPGVRVPIQRTGMGIVVSPRDTVGLASAIGTILKHPADYKKDRAVIRDQFSEHACIDFYEKIICD